MLHSQLEGAIIIHNIFNVYVIRYIDDVDSSCCNCYKTHMYKNKGEKCSIAIIRKLKTQYKYSFQSLQVAIDPTPIMGT